MKRFISLALALMLMLGGCGSSEKTGAQSQPAETESKTIMNAKVFKGTVTIVETGKAGPAGTFVNTLISIDYLYLDKERNALRILERKLKYTGRVETLLDQENNGMVTESGELTEQYGFDEAPVRLTLEDGIFVPDPERKSKSWVSEAADINTEAGDFTETGSKTDITLLAHPIELTSKFDYDEDSVKFDKEYDAVNLANISCSGTITCDYALASQDEIDDLLSRLPKQSNLKDDIDWSFDLSQLAEREHSSLDILLSAYTEPDSGLADLTQNLLNTEEYPESLDDRLDALEVRADEAYSTLTDDISAFNEILPDMIEGPDEDTSSLAKAAARYEDNFEAYTDDFQSDMADLFRLEDDLSGTSISDEDQQQIQSLFDEIDNKLSECNEEADLLIRLSDDARQLFDELEGSAEKERIRLLDEFFQEWIDKLEI